MLYRIFRCRHTVTITYQSYGNAAAVFKYRCERWLWHRGEHR